jgi:hypothetical protein
MPHGDAVVDGDGVEFGRKAAQGVNLRLDPLADVMQVDMTGHELGEGIDHGDHRPADLLLAHAVGPPQGAGARHSSPFRGCRAAQWVCHCSPRRVVYDFFLVFALRLAILPMYMSLSIFSWCRP